MTPAVSTNRLAATVGARTEWCISRQRSWGVPIPAFFDAETYVHMQLSIQRKMQHNTYAACHAPCMECTSEGKCNYCHRG